MPEMKGCLDSSVIAGYTQMTTAHSYFQWGAASLNDLYITFSPSTTRKLSQFSYQSFSLKWNTKWSNALWLKEIKPAMYCTEIKWVARAGKEARWPPILQPVLISLLQMAQPTAVSIRIALNFFNMLWFYPIMHISNASLSVSVSHASYCWSHSRDHKMLSENAVKSCHNSTMNWKGTDASSFKIMPFTAFLFIKNSCFPSQF